MTHSEESLEVYSAGIESAVQMVDRVLDGIILRHQINEPDRMEPEGVRK